MGSSEVTIMCKEISLKCSDTVRYMRAESDFQSPRISINSIGSPD